MQTEKQDNFPQVIVVHHSAGNGGFNVIQNWHVIGRGWENVGYHYVIEKDGEIVNGRPEHYHGAHTKQVNTKSIGICLVGDFDKDLPTEEQKESLIKLYNDIIKRHPQLKNSIFPHRMYKDTHCYGTNLSDSWAFDLVTKEEEKENYIKIPRELAEELKKYL